MGSVKNHWLKTVKFSSTGFAKAEKIICADGFSISAQASELHYCAPRSVLRSGEYSAWEVGFPTSREETLMPYSDGDENTDPTETVYGYVPTDVIDAIIAAHGGLKAEVA